MNTDPKNLPEAIELHKGHTLQPVGFRGVTLGTINHSVDEGFAKKLVTAYNSHDELMDAVNTLITAPPGEIPYFKVKVQQLIAKITNKPVVSATQQTICGALKDAFVPVGTHSGRIFNKNFRDVELEDIQSFIAHKTVNIAMQVGGTVNKSLDCTMNGTFKVTHNGKQVWSGMQAYSAMEEYNKIGKEDNEQ